jgi:hypothetical protein
VPDKVVVTPSALLLENCASGTSDGSLGGELQRLADLVRCEWGHNDTLKAWFREFRTP